MSGMKSWNGHEGPVLDARGGYEVIDCASCGFAHLIPIPDPPLLEQIYREDYYDAIIPDYIERHMADRDWWDLVYGQRYAAIDELLPAGERSILDIGSGPGLFLLNGMRRGWRTLGFEPSRQAWRHATETLGLDVRNLFFSPETAKNIGIFDAIHMSEVMEHIPNPAGMLAVIRTVLRAGGALCLVVPNDYNPIQKALREQRGFEPWWVSPPHHVNYFTFDSMSRLLERSGFDIRVREATFPIDAFLLLGLDYTGDDMLGQQCHGWRMRLETAFAEAGLDHARRALYRTMAELGLGRHIMIIATARDLHQPSEEQKP